MRSARWGGPSGIVVLFLFLLSLVLLCVPRRPKPATQRSFAQSRDLAKIIPDVEELPYDVFRGTGLKLPQMLGDDLGVLRIADLPGGSCGGGLLDVADPLSHS